MNVDYLVSGNIKHIHIKQFYCPGYHSLIGENENECVPVCVLLRNLPNPKQDLRKIPSSVLKLCRVGDTLEFYLDSQSPHRNESDTYESLH